MSPYTVFLIITVVYLIVCTIAAFFFLSGNDCDLNTKITFWLNISSPIFILGAVLIAKFAASDL